MYKCDIEEVIILINYEVLNIGEEEVWVSFQSSYEIRQNERLFLDKDGVTYSLNVSKVTHNLKEGIHIVRLNCHSHAYKN